MSDPATEMYRTRADALATVDGTGPGLVCAHGTLMDRTMFSPQLTALADSYQVAAYDLRARTERFGQPYDLWDLVEDCAALIEGLEMDQPVLAGMSMGGFMGLRFALRYPDQISGLILIDSISEPHPEEEIDLYTGMINDIREAPSVPRDMAKTVTQFLFGKTTLAQQKALVESWVERWCTYPGESVYQEVSSWIEREDITTELHDVDIPTLIVHGEEDASLSVEQTDSVMDVLDAERVVIPEAGHSSNLENPAPVNEAIRSFLSEVYA